MAEPSLGRDSAPSRPARHEPRGWRPYIVYRRRRPARPAEPGTTDHRWRKIGAPG